VFNSTFARARKWKLYLARHANFFSIIVWFSAARGKTNDDITVGDYNQLELVSFQDDMWCSFISTFD
jgi:hypothetical protein